MGSFSQWNPLTDYVQGGMEDGRFANGGLTLLAAGPPRLTQVGGVGSVVQVGEGEETSDFVFPIGCMQNVNLSQNKAFMRVWELGSDRSYFIGGRTIGQLGLSRLFYHGPSMLRVLFAYYKDSGGVINIPWLFANIGASSTANPHHVWVPPGYENLFLNLASDLFNQSIGILMYMRDSNLDTLGSLYVEGCTIPNHTWATDAQGVVIQESATIQYERLVPVNVKSVSLVTGFDLSLVSNTFPSV
jgi:hypothetical protein